MKRAYDTVVVGAGQAGLAAGFYLQQAGRDFLILDANARVGDSWRRRWEGLQLFSPNAYNCLPGMRPEGDPDALPDRLELADYLEAYAKNYKLPLRLATKLERAVKTEGGWRLETSGGEIRTANLIVATGAYRTPFIPSAVAKTLPESITQLHSSEVRRVEELASDDLSTLVVGAGASGQQLSKLILGLAAGSEVILVGDALPDLPRNVLGRDIYYWLYRSGLMTARTDRFPGKWLGSEGGDVTVAEHPKELAAHPRLRRIKTKLSHYKDGALEFTCNQTMPDALPWPPPNRRPLVIWCTGYRNRYPWLPPLATGPEGEALHAGGVSTRLAGLFFLGLPKLLRPNSSLVGGVGRDAERIVGML